MTLRVSFDVGGTFTDLVLVDGASGESWFEKRLTTHRDVSEGVGSGVTALLSSSKHTAQEVTHPVVGATTLMTNALIERSGGPVALVTTRGFKDLIEIGRETRYDLYDLRLELPPSLVPPEARLEVTERVLADGSVRGPLDLEEVDSVVSSLRELGVRAVAVCFLHSYVNPDHEVAVQKELERKLPGVLVTTSAATAPEIREVERLNTTIANAYVQPVAGEHFDRMECRLREIGLDRGLHLMQSNGGITDVDQATKFPIRLLESGPAAGALGAASWGRRLGVKNLISFDMGGTTAKICLIKDFQASIAHAFEIARAERFKPGSGLTVRVPVIDMLEVGAGGGSIARLDVLGLLKVGPTSAGSDPGPACYGLGGDQPTVTDADLVLGYLDPSHFLGGRMSLDAEAAVRAVETNLASGFDSSTVDAAAGVVRVVDEGMALAARVHVTEKGDDPRDYVLFAYGGAGPLHACAVARILGIARVIVPASAGVLAATGLQTAIPTVSLVQTRLMRVSDWDGEAVTKIFDNLVARAAQALSGFASRGLVFERAVDMRFRGQGFEVEVALPEIVALDDLVARFEHRYQALYRSLPPTSEPEVVSWRLTAELPRCEGPPIVRRGWPGQEEQPAPGMRSVWFAESGWVDTAVYRHRDLRPDQLLEGPAIVHQDESTIVIGPFDSARVDEFGNCWIEIGA